MAASIQRRVSVTRNVTLLPRVAHAYYARISWLSELRCRRWATNRPQVRQCAVQGCSASGGRLRKSARQVRQRKK